MLQLAAWAHSSSSLYHLARILSASNNTSEVLALSHCINTGPRKSQNSTRCCVLLLRRFNGIHLSLENPSYLLLSILTAAKLYITMLCASCLFSSILIHSDL